MNWNKYIRITNVVMVFIVVGLLVLVLEMVKEYVYNRNDVSDTENIVNYTVNIDDFVNPIMADDTLRKLKWFSEDKNVDFCKLTALALVLNGFDLSKFKIDEINLNKYDRAYTYLKSNKKCVQNREYLELIEAILRDVECFPVKKDCEYLYEDTFGSPRNYNGNYSHEGTDIMSKNDVSGICPIVSASDGVVENVGWLPKGGYRVGIRGNNGIYFYYAHLHEGSINVEEGEKVEAGQLIGYMGNTGYGEEGTKGKFPVHLHFGIYVQTKECEELAINPYYIIKYMDQIDG